jgi:hypothetical protein
MKMATRGATTSKVESTAKPVAKPSIPARIRAFSLCSSRTFGSPKNSYQQTAISYQFPAPS